MRLPKALLLATLFGLLGLLGVLTLLGHPRDLLVLAELPGWSLAASLVLLALSFLCGGLRIALLARLLGYRLRLLSAVRGHILGLFSAALTPSGGGNAPAVALMLMRDGLPKAHAWSVALYLTVVDVLFFVWTVPLAVLALKGTVEEFLPGLLWLGGLTSLLCLGVWYLLAFCLEGTAKLIVKLFGWRPLRRWQARAERFAGTLTGAVTNLSYGGKRVQVALQLQTVGVHVSVFAIFLAIAWGLELPTAPLPTLATFLLVFVASFLVPTPGGSGFLEFALSWLLASQSETALVAPAVLVWRLLSFYSVFLLGPILGGAALSKHLPASPTPGNGD